MRKAMAVNSLVVMILILITLLVLFTVVFFARDQGSSVISDFFRFLRT